MTGVVTTTSAPSATASIASPENHAGLIREHIKKGDRDIQKGEDHYKAAGILLAQYKAVAKSQSATWPVFLDQYCEIKTRRANELIAIGDGRKTLAQIRGETRERVERHRALRNARSGEAHTDAEVDKALATSAPAERVEKAYRAYLTAVAALSSEDRKDLLAVLPRVDDADSVKTRLQRASDTISHLKSRIKSMESFSIISGKHANSETGKRMFAEQAKEKLAREVEDLKAHLAERDAEIERLKSRENDAATYESIMAAFKALPKDLRLRFMLENIGPAHSSASPAPASAEPLPPADGNSASSHNPTPAPADETEDDIPAFIKRDHKPVRQGRPVHINNGYSSNPKRKSA